MNDQWFRWSEKINNSRLLFCFWFFFAACPPPPPPPPLDFAIFVHHSTFNLLNLRSAEYVILCKIFMLCYSRQSAHILFSFLKSRYFGLSPVAFRSLQRNIFMQNIICIFYISRLENKFGNVKTIPYTVVSERRASPLSDPPRPFETSVFLVTFTWCRAILLVCWP